MIMLQARAPPERYAKKYPYSTGRLNGHSSKTGRCNHENDH
jgi:hypothetical protein